MSGPIVARIMKLCVVSLFLPISLFAQSNVESRSISSSVLKQMVPKTAHAGEPAASFGMTKQFAGKEQSAATSGLPGVDSLANWSDQFIVPGFDFSGKPQSVWPYTMVGTPPESGIATHIHAPVVPVDLELLGPDGKVAVFHGHPLRFIDTPEIVKAIVNSPVFENFPYASGTGQFNDVMMRTQFWDRIRHSSGGGDEEGDNNSDNNNTDSDGTSC